MDNFIKWNGIVAQQLGNNRKYFIMYSLAE